MADITKLTVSFADDTWPPRFLAGGFGVSFAWPTPEQAAAEAGGLVATLTAATSGVWHVEAADPVGYLNGVVPTHRYHGPAAILVGMHPIFGDPADESARGLAGEHLAGLLTSFGACPDAVQLIDWALLPTRRALGLAAHGWFNAFEPGQFDTRADAYAILRRARAQWLTPWLDGARRVRTLAAFRELHVDMPDDEAFLAAYIWQQGSLSERSGSNQVLTANGRLASAVDGLITRGWIERVPAPYSRGTILNKTRRFAHRMPRVEALAC